MKCPSCDGKGEFVLVTSGELTRKEIPYNKGWHWDDNLKKVISKCLRCNGKGVISKKKS